MRVKRRHQKLLIATSFIQSSDGILPLMKTHLALRQRQGCRRYYFSPFFGCQFEIME
jgi:hypothetical protein